MSEELLTADQILAAEDLREEIVEVPGWGGKVRIREPHGDARVQLDKVLRSEREPLEIAARATVLCLVGLDGAPVFPYDDATVKRLMEKSERNLRACRLAVGRVCQLLTDEELRKVLGKSGATRGDDGSTAIRSPAGSPTPTSSSADTPAAS